MIFTCSVWFSLVWVVSRAHFKGKRRLSELSKNWCFSQDSEERIDAVRNYQLQEGKGHMNAGDLFRL